MKNLKYFLFAALATFTFSCDTNDDGFYNETYVDIPNLVQIEVQPSYNVGDHLFIDASISRFLDEPGEDLPLDIYTTTGGANAFDFSYVLEKNIDGEWQPVNLPNELLIINEGGSYITLPIIYAYANYDMLTEMYRSNIGIPLETAGEFRLRFGASPNTPTKVALRSQSEGNNLSLNITSSVDQLGADGSYNFTVN